MPAEHVDRQNFSGSQLLSSSVSITASYVTNWQSYFPEVTQKQKDTFIPSSATLGDNQVETRVSFSLDPYISDISQPANWSTSQSTNSTKKATAAKDVLTTSCLFFFIL